MNLKMAATIRAKKLGVLLRKAREDAGRSKKECGLSIGVSSSTINSFENGVKSPSLPQLEMLAHSLKVPIEFFWKDDISPDSSSTNENIHTEHHLSLRNQSVGKLLQEARIKKDLTFKDIREKTSVTPGRMKKYENGDSAMQIPELERLCQVLDLRINELIATDNTIGEWIHEKKAIEDFKKLTLETQAFISQPVNQPYIELASHLSTLSAKQLRAIAEGLLEITI